MVLRGLAVPLPVVVGPTGTGFGPASVVLGNGVVGARVVLRCVRSGPDVLHDVVGPPTGNLVAAVLGLRLASVLLPCGGVAAPGVVVVVEGEAVV